MKLIEKNWVTQLAEKGYVKLKFFLSHERANEYRQQILHSSHFKAWKLLTTPHRSSTAIQNKFSFNRNERQKHKLAINGLKRRQFSFSFYRSTNKHAYQHSRQFIHQEVAKQLVNDICPVLGLSGEIRDSFFARFEKGQFISYHTDGKAGQYAFIYQLSKGWQRKYGGQLVLYPNRSRFYRKLLEPEFNTLTLLKLNHPMPHSVKMLNNPKHKHRLTISGWLE